MLKSCNSPSTEILLDTTIYKRDAKRGVLGEDGLDWLF
jgi:hypothetical protein